MLQTLFHIPHEIAGLPVFGLGWALLIWAIVCTLWLVLIFVTGAPKKDVPSALMLMAIVAVTLAIVMPNIEERRPDPANPTELVPVGVPIRGYGAMMVVAIVVGVGLAGYRARRMGLDPEVIFSLAFWMLVAGIIGARLFFVVQKWEQFQRETWQETLFALLDFVGGGLVVYGSAIGALLALVVFCRRRKLPVLAVADLVAPSMMIGLAIGRIGCLLNGCCYGGLCETELGVQFPPEAPAYQDQLAQGMLFGVRLAAKDPQPDGRETVVIDWVRPGSEAEKAGYRAGDEVDFLMGQKLDNLRDAQLIMLELPRIIGQNEARGRPTPLDLHVPGESRQPILIGKLPQRSLPIHATQIYSAVDAFLLFLVLWFFYPFRRRDGEVLALMLTLHPISRFMLEIIRTDEAGVFGTPLTISQWVGIGLLLVAVALWMFIERRPRATAFPLAA